MLGLDLARISSDAVDIAQSVPIETELGRRGVSLRRQGRRELVGPCPACGGTDRFAINIAKQLWNCRGCDKGGDIIDLVQHLDGGEFLDAVETLAGRRPRGNATAAREQARERDRINREKKAREDARKTADAIRMWNEGTMYLEHAGAGVFGLTRVCWDVPGGS